MIAVAYGSAVKPGSVKPGAVVNTVQVACMLLIQLLLLLTGTIVDFVDDGEVVRFWHRRSHS